MLLAIDIGNTHTVLGVFIDDALVADWRISTSPQRTADENAVLLTQLLDLRQTPAGAIDSAVVSSVVPGAIQPMCGALEMRFAVEALVVGPDLDTGMPIRYENPAEVGADRIVNAVAAYEEHRRGLIVVDFGTATTFDCISPAGEYLGGAIAPGALISADALYRKAAKLPRVAIRRPPAVVGRNTVASMQSGLFFGYAGLVDGIVARMKAELDFETRVIATGGLAHLIQPASALIDEADDLLTLRGLCLIHRRVHQRAPGTSQGA
jgi:type III pantothenate kinase